MKWWPLFTELEFKFKKAWVKHKINQTNITEVIRGNGYGSVVLVGMERNREGKFTMIHQAKT